MPRSFALRLALPFLAVAHAAACAAGPAIENCEFGFQGKYKLGHWLPVVVQTQSADGCRVEVVAPDYDGVAVAYQGGPIDADGASRLRIQIGQPESPVTVRLLDDDGAVDSRFYSPYATATLDRLPAGLSPTSRLIVQLGAGDSPLVVAADDRPATTVRLGSAERLPTSVAAFDAVDCLVLDMSKSDALASLAADGPRVRALTRWVESGGKLLLAGASGAEAVIGAGGPLADLAPGKLVDVVPLADPSPLERYAESDQPVAGGRRVAIPTARLTGVAGLVEASAGGRAEALPLVVRASRGFGEVVFITSDISAGPLAEWEGRPALLVRAAGLNESRSTNPASAAQTRLAAAKATDLAGALVKRLGSRFRGVTAVSMFTVVGLAIGYLLLIGPADYFLLKRGVGHFAAAWITFPAIVAAVAGGAYLLAGRLGGDGPRVNQIELLDMDTTSGAVRGMLWAQAYSPAALRYDVSLATRWPDGSPMACEAQALSWIGVPGRGLGGLERPPSGLVPLETSYSQDASLATLTGLPINIRSTKSLFARWQRNLPSAGLENLVTADLTSPDAGVLDGVVTNNSGADLTRCWLALGDWAWRVGELGDGATVSIAGLRSPVKLKTLVRNDHLSAPPTGGARRGRQLETDELDVDGLLHLMMFSEALGGGSLTDLPNHYQAFTDLSAQLWQGRAVLVAQAAGRKSELLNAGQSWSEPTDASRTYYRFVLPVK